MKTIQNGDVIVAHYVGKLADGTVFDQANEKNPMSFIVGAETILPKINEAFLGMQIGEEKELSIAPEDAFGQREDNNIRKLSRLYLKETEQFHIGQVVELKMEKGVENQYGKIISCSADHVVIDTNHPLAGQTLYYTIKIIDILRKEEA